MRRAQRRLAKRPGVDCKGGLTSSRRRFTSWRGGNAGRLIRGDCWGRRGHLNNYHVRRATLCIKW